MKAWLSYSQVDKMAAEKISSAFIYCGYEVLTLEDPSDSMSLSYKIVHGIKEADIIVFVLSSASKNNNYINSEIAIAYSLYIETKKKIIPIIIDKKVEIPPFLGEFPAINLDSSRNLENDVVTFISRIKNNEDKSEDVDFLKNRLELLKHTQEMIKLEKEIQEFTLKQRNKSLIYFFTASVIILVNLIFLLYSAISFKASFSISSGSIVDNITLFVLGLGLFITALFLQPLIKKFNLRRFITMLRQYRGETHE